MMNTPLNIVWDMETNDPDDFLTLLMLAGHPQVHLKAVTVTPGTPYQVGLVRHALHEWFKLDIPIGARNINHENVAVSDWHYQAYGNVAPSTEAEPAADVLLANCDSETTLLTGAPLNNLRLALNQADAEKRPFIVEKLVVQGGFAGEGVVPPELQMEKFKGLRTCPTFNLGGDVKAAQRVLVHEGFPLKYFVSKNVCHRMVYDAAMHDYLAQVKHKSLSLELIYQGMTAYLKEHPAGKIVHDVLAACCAIDPTIATWREVELFREKGEWGARLSPDSHTWIIIDYDHDKFLRIFTES